MDSKRLQTPKVSVMIPTYNQEDYIAQAIESVLMQDYENIEIIIADDCSTDKTGEIAKRYTSDKRVKYVCNHPNLGRVGNYRNTLHQHATGDWVVNLDGDDYYTDPSLISRTMQMIQSHPTVVCYFGSNHFPNALNSYDQYKIAEKSYLMNGKFYLQHFSLIGAFSHLATFYKREIAIADGKCYTYPGIQSDFHGVVRLSVYGDVILSHEYGYHWRKHANNATNSFHDFRRKYIQGRRSQYWIMRDVGNHFTEQEKKQWLDDSFKNVKEMYVIDNLVFVHNLHSLKIGLLNFKWSRGFIIIYIKALLATFFGINLF